MDCKLLQFKKFPEVLIIDVTNGTNRNELPFVSFVGKDSHGKTFTVVHAFVANERAFTLYWLLKVFVSKTLLRKYRERVRLIITDGDQTEFGQVDEAINSRIFPNALRARCGWHIIDRGWNKNGPSVKVFSPNVSNQWRCNFHLVKRTVIAWLYSWMKPTCETEEEYLFSKHILKKWLKSVTLKISVGEEIASRIE